MRHVLCISKSGLDSVRIYPARTLATGLTLLVVLVPYFAGKGIAEGVHHDALISLESGGDLYLSSMRFGARVSVATDFIDRVASIPGVEQAIPRIIGRIVLGTDRHEAVVVGLPVESFPRVVTCVKGRLPEKGAAREFVVGSELAGSLNLNVDSSLPPFYRNRRGEGVSRIVGVFHSDVTIWQSKLMFCTIATAAEIFDESNYVTDVVVWCRPGYQRTVANAARKLAMEAESASEGVDRISVVSRDDLSSTVASWHSHSEGVFSLHYVFMLSAAMLVILVTSGAGLRERRREIGILKATGWQTDEVILRCLLENVMISLLSTCVATLVARIWLQFFNGYLIAGVYLSGVGLRPSFRIPFHLTVTDALTGFLVSTSVILVGALYPTWRSAIVSPMEAMR